MSTMEVKKRETSSEFEYEGRNFIINAYDPLTGNYILMQILTQVLPMGLGDALKKEAGSEVNLPKADSGVKLMSKQEFIELQKDILSTVYEKFESGNKSPVIRENGTYGVSDLSMGLTINLLVASLAFNFKDFFEGVPSPENITQLMK